MAHYINEDSAGNWRSSIYSELRKRDDRDGGVYKEIICQLNAVTDRCENYRLENVQLTLHQYNTENGTAASSNTNDKHATLVQELEGKLYRLGEEVTQLHRSKSDTAEQLMSLTNCLQERDKESLILRNRISDLESEVMLLKEEIERKCKECHDFTEDNTLIRDEYNSLNLAYGTIEKKYTAIKKENTQLVERWIQYKSLDAERLNAENDKHHQLRQRDMVAKLDEAAKDFKLVVVPSEPDAAEMAMGTLAYPCSVVPTACYYNQETHDADLHTLRVSNSGRMMATGGEDRKLKLWSVRRDGFSLCHKLLGCNAGINSIEFSPDDSLIMAASTDQACRIWSLQDQRIRHTLTGHSGKVMSCKFVPDMTKVVSGGHDRTIKIWDLKSKACSRTIFVGSSCNDLTLSKSSSTVVFSGHHDRKLRVYDLRTNTEATAEVSVKDKVTSVTLLNNGFQCLLSCRDNMLRVVDVRQKMILSELSAEGVQLGSDIARACASPDDSYCAVGSTDGSVHVWDLQTAALATTPLTGTHTSCVMVCSWTPDGRSFVSCERSKLVCMWM